MAKFQGKKGRSGRRKLSVEMAFFNKLDKGLPKAIDYCEGLIDIAKTYDKIDPDKIENPMERGEFLKERKCAKELAVRASSVMMSRAPERLKHSGDEDSPIHLSVDL